MASSPPSKLDQWEAEFKTTMAKLDEENKALTQKKRTMDAAFDAERNLENFQDAVEAQLDNDYHTDVKPEVGKDQPGFVSEVGLPGLSGDKLGRHLESVKVSEEDVSLWIRLTEDAVYRAIKDNLNEEGKTHVLEKRKVDYVKALLARHPELLNAKWRIMAEAKHRSPRSFESKYEQFKEDVLRRMSYVAQEVSGAKASKVGAWCEKKANFLESLLESIDREGDNYVKELGESSYHVYRLMVQNLLDKTRLDQKMYAQIPQIRAEFDD